MSLLVHILYIFMHLIFTPTTLSRRGKFLDPKPNFDKQRAAKESENRARNFLRMLELHFVDESVVGVAHLLWGFQQNYGQHCGDQHEDPSQKQKEPTHEQ